MEIITRKEAGSKGLTRYFTGAPCKRGHVAERQVSNRSCVVCLRAWQMTNSEKQRAQERAWRSANPEKHLAQKRAWKAANSAVVRAHKAKRHANKLKAAPPWLSKEQLRRMVAKYVEAKKYEALSGTEWHVDHIVPLQGETVCGLHAPWNLRVIPAVDNLSKSNKLLEAA